MLCGMVCVNDEVHSLFFFNDTATTEIYTLSLHDALPISFALAVEAASKAAIRNCPLRPRTRLHTPRRDRKSTRLNSSHSQISYAVFCLKKKCQSAHACPDYCNPLLH